MVRQQTPRLLVAFFDDSMHLFIDGVGRLLAVRPLAAYAVEILQIRALARR